MTASTASLAATAWKDANVVELFQAGGLLHVHAFSAVSVATTSIDEVNDIFEIGYLPKGVTVHGFIVTATDMDTNVSPALAYKLRVNAVDLVTGVTSGQAAGTTLYWCTPTATAGYEVVDAKVTVVSATPAAGTVTVRVLYTPS